MTTKDKSWTARRPLEDRIDVPALVRATPTGFTVFVFTSLLMPLVNKIATDFAPWWSAVTLAATFAAAALRRHQAHNAALHGAVAAMSAYLLCLPLVILVSNTANLGQILGTLAAGAVVGAGVSALRRRLGAWRHQGGEPR